LFKDQAVALGVRFHFHTDVRAIRPGATVVLSLAPAASESTYPGDRHGADGPESVLPAGMAPAAPMEAPNTDFDAVVLGNAMAANTLLQPHGLRLPMAAVHGYSLTASLRPDPRAPHEVPSRGPRSALMDERYKVALTRLGNRVRVSGSAQLGGAPQALHQGAIHTLHRVLHDWFPGAADLRQSQRWKGSRAMLPDGPPVIGPSGLGGVFLNLGQGGSGWAMACGSARVLADQIAGRHPAIDTSGLGIARLGLTPAV